MYKLATGKLRQNVTLTTLRTGYGNYTIDMESTIQHMIEYFTPEDREREDSAHHKYIREQITKPIGIPDDDEFTKQEITAALKTFNSRKAPGEDSLNNEIILKTFDCFPTFITEIYNQCLRKGIFPR